MSLERLAQETIGSILAKLDKRSIIAAICTAKFMRREGERLLYGVVTFHFDEDRRDKLARRKEMNFVRAIVWNPELGLYVRELTLNIDFPDWFYPSVHGSDLEKNPSAITRAIKSMPNLKVLDLDVLCPWSRTSTAFLEYPTPFKLKKLKLNVHHEFMFTKDQIVRVLQNQPNLQHFALPLGPRPGLIKEAKAEGPSAAMACVDLRGVCPLLEVLEGGYWAVLTLLPGRRAKHLSWMGNSNLPCGIYSTATFLAPFLCEAYSRLEIISLRYSSSGFLQLAPHLTSLKCLVLHDQRIWDASLHSRISGAVRQIIGLERVFIVIHTEHLLVPLPQRAEDIFNPQEAAAYFRTCTNLKTITVLFNRCRVDTELRILGYRRGQRGEPLAVLIPDNAAIFCQVPLSFFLGLASTLKVLLKQ